MIFSDWQKANYVSRVRKIPASVRVNQYKERGGENVY